jgi:hypothetical protein
MEQALAQRNARVSLKPGKSRAALTITHPNAGAAAADDVTQDHAHTRALRTIA